MRNLAAKSDSKRVSNRSTTIRKLLYNSSE